RGKRSKAWACRRRTKHRSLAIWDPPLVRSAPVFFQALRSRLCAGRWARGELHGCAVGDQGACACPSGTDGDLREDGAGGVAEFPPLNRELPERILGLRRGISCGGYLGQEPWWGYQLRSKVSPPEPTQSEESRHSCSAAGGSREAAKSEGFHDGFQKVL